MKTRKIVLISSVIISGLCLTINYVINPANIFPNIIFAKTINALLFLSIVSAMIASYRWKK
jgi:hypothetical protein